MISENSISFEHILKISTEYLYENYRHSNEALRTNKIIDEIHLNMFLFNPILSYYIEYNIIKPYQTMGNPSTICGDFQIVTPSLFTLYKSFKK